MITPLLLAAALVATAAPAVAQKVPVGPQFQVNEITTGQQGDFHGPAVASDAAGNFVIVWETTYGYPYGSLSLRGFDTAGAPAGPEVPISTYGSAPDVSASPAGTFVVVWQDSDRYDLGDYYGTGVVGRRFDGTGTALGPEFLVNTTTTSWEGHPKVASDAAGNFVVVWHHYDLGSYVYSFITGQRFDGTGARIGGEFQVNSYTTGVIGYGLTVAEDADGIEIASAPAGSFMVAWSHYGRDGDENGIFARAFDATGTPLGGDVQVNTYTTGSQEGPSVAADGAGTFLVVWAESGTGAVSGRRFSATGTPLGGEFAVNTTPPDFVYSAKVSGDPAGDFVVVWSKDYQTIVGRRFDTSDTPLGGEFEVAPLGGYPYDITRPAVAADATGDFVVTWQDRYRDGDGSGIFAQRFASPTGPCTPDPKTTCRKPTIARKGSLLLRAGATPARDRLVWRWQRGEASAPGDLGDPFTSTDAALCLYDASGPPQPILAAVAPAGGTCGNHPCWRTLGGARIEYLDPALDPDGIRRLRLTPGADGQAAVAVIGKGAALGLPAGPLVLPVVAQLQSASGECWTATYVGFVVRNQPGLFRASPDL